MGIFNKKNKTLNIEKLPYHIAIIIDGNGRWAKHYGLPRTFGHKKGVERVKETIFNACDLHIKELSFFCFSTENWNRPKDEVDAIFNMLRDFVENDLQQFIERDIRFIVSGDVTPLPKDLQGSIQKAVEQTKNNKAMLVNLCINYGGRSEVIYAVNNLLKNGKTEITFQDFENELYSSEMHDIDLLIRTSGEQRISNFMLYRLAYAELYFTKTYWPDFNKKELIKALIDFQSRNRRFGEIKEEKK